MQVDGSATAPLTPAPPFGHSVWIHSSSVAITEAVASMGNPHEPKWGLTDKEGQPCKKGVDTNARSAQCSHSPGGDTGRAEQR